MTYSLPDYRKLAFDTYAPICVHCGFGVREVLEVAHLDGNRANNSLSNLVILCPTCHRMHDIDLIPTDAVVRLRDEKRKARWSKLTKNAAKKAIVTMRKTPGRLEAIAQKAVATRRARKSSGAI
jgi:5-methylcytosine-specific restriction endonuclease McrA